MKIKNDDVNISLLPFYRTVHLNVDNLALFIGKRETC